MKIAYKSSVQS